MFACPVVAAIVVAALAVVLIVAIVTAHGGEVALSSYVNVWLKTSDEDDTKESLAKFIHQALVRREVVVTLIENAVERGHRAYRHLDIQRVR
jgi:hypothetical protein